MVQEAFRRVRVSRRRSQMAIAYRSAYTIGIVSTTSPTKSKGIANWLDNNVPRAYSPIWDSYRYYAYGYYTDPDDGWDYYGSSRLSFDACGNRGPQSSCGVVWCVNTEGNSSGTVPQFPIPKGESPYVDPNDRNRICPWLRDG
jgi:hypothetical protein